MRAYICYIYIHYNTLIISCQYTSAFFYCPVKKSRQFCHSVTDAIYYLPYSHFHEIVIRHLYRLERVSLAHILPISSAVLRIPGQLRFPVPTDAK